MNPLSFWCHQYAVTASDLYELFIPALLISFGLRTVFVVIALRLSNELTSNNLFAFFKQSALPILGALLSWYFVSTFASVSSSQEVAASASDFAPHGFISEIGFVVMMLMLEFVFFGPMLLGFFGVMLPAAIDAVAFLVFIVVKSVLRIRNACK